MTDAPRPERDLDPAALDELFRAFADHQRDRTPVEGPVVDPDDLEPTAPTPAVVSESELTLADLVTSVDAPDYEIHEPTPRALGEPPRPIIKIGDADAVFGELAEPTAPG